ncbi:hypothetical protein P8H26_13755 [Pseudochrobactrum sp. sp1633]|uniref:hypothetical protein n=1 Tax=Pseudochrobactrum sp. sp1633 TaxID=3036706 RepID=UPI0025A67944|nr:hypothetical protein [Pseudochrobactrum sp. sp1633]MDM8346459.1 hypothetical protein [Pseudochrobactrum sp. sp1633]
MNRIFSETLSVLNATIGFLIIATGAYFGYKSPFGGTTSIIIGTVVGVIIAAVTCGIVSLLVLIEGHLAKLTSPNTEIKRNEPRF